MESSLGSKGGLAIIGAMCRVPFIVLVLLFIFGLNVKAIDIITWVPAWPTPMIKFNDQTYYLDTIDSDGIGVLSELYRDDPELLSELENAKTRAKLEAVSTTIGSGLIGTDIVVSILNLMPFGTLTFFGGIALISAPYMLPNSHVDLLRKSVEKYNAKHG